MLSARPAGQGPAERRRDGVPELRAVSLADGAGERRARAWRRCGIAAAERRKRALAAIDLIGLDGFESRLSEGAVGRHAPARRLRPRAGGASRPAADGRAVLGARRADRRDPAHRPDRSVVRGPAADQVGADGDAQHRGGGADVRPHPGVLVQSRPRRRRDQGRSAASAQPARSGVPAAGRRHLCPDDRSGPSPRRRPIEGIPGHRHRHDPAARLDQPAFGPDRDAGGAAIQRTRRPAGSCQPACNSKPTKYSTSANRCNCCGLPN